MKKSRTYLLLPILALFGLTVAISVAQFPKKSTVDSGTVETMIVAQGSITMQIDVNRLNGIGGGVESKPETLQFQPAADSFMPVITYNNVLRGVSEGTVRLVPLNGALLPVPLNNSFQQLVLERTPAGEAFEFVVRDAKTNFTYFNIEGYEYRYDATTRTLEIANGRMLISEEFAKEMQRPADAGTAIGTLSLATALRVIEVRTVVNGEDQSVSLPSSRSLDADAPAFVPGPDVIVGDLPAMVQSGSSGSQVGLAIATTSCNNGTTQLNWFAMPNADHPVIPQNLYRLSANGDRLEQIGQSWLKHAFTALQQNACAFGCTSSGTGTRLGVGCSDPYDTGLNGSQTGLGSRAWVNPFTGVFPSTARDHTSHSHVGTSHRILVNASDLNTTMNVGAIYYGEAQYVTPHEYVWCQSHPGECNMYNNASYRRFNVTGTTSFSFSGNGATVRMQPAINAWPGATIQQVEPAPGIDGRAFVAYKVTGPTAGVYHYEYAVYNQHLDRSIQSFGVPLGCGVTLSNVGFRAPLNHPGMANDGTAGGTGYSNNAWTPNQTTAAITWSSETFTQNQNANAIRWGTMYNFRFDSTRAPRTTMATVGFFKTGEPITVEVQAPTPDTCNALQAVSAVSRKTHGSAGTFDISMPFGQQPGIESRRSSDGTHTLIFTFTNDVMSGNATVTEGTGSVAGGPTFSGNTMTVTLTGVPNAERVRVMLSGVTDPFAQTMPDTSLVMKALFGDTDGSSGVTASDIGRVKSEANNPVTASNFRSDLTADGNVSSSDIGVVKSMAGATLP